MWTLTLWIIWMLTTHRWHSECNCSFFCISKLVGTKKNKIKVQNAKTLVTTTWMSISTSLLWAQIHKIFSNTIPWIYGARAWSWRVDVPLIHWWKTDLQTTLHNWNVSLWFKDSSKVDYTKSPFTIWRLFESWPHKNQVVHNLESALHSLKTLQKCPS